MSKVGQGNSTTKVVFDPSLGRHGGTRYRGVDGRFAPNPDKGKPWYCQKSPTGAHHWTITARAGQCKYCNALREMGQWATAGHFIVKRSPR